MFFMPTKKEWLQLGVSFMASAALCGGVLYMDSHKKAEAQAAKVSLPPAP